MESMNIQEKLLPVSETAKLSLEFLAHAGIEDAKYIVDKLGIKGTIAYYFYEISDEEQKINQVIYETRYEFVNYQIRNTGIKRIIDLGCGFSPRGLEFAKEGYSYIGVDLPCVIDTITPVAETFMEEQKPSGKIEYKAVDVTDPEAVKRIAENNDGDVVIIAEGLLMFLQAFETDQMFKGIRAILEEKGGFFITPDLVSDKIYLGAYLSQFGTLKGHSKFAKTKKTIESKADADAGNSIILQKVNKNNDELKRMGFIVGFVPYYVDPQGNFKSLDALNSKISEKIRTKYSNIMCHKLHCDTVEGKTTETTSVPYEELLEIACEKSDSTATLKLKGRVDSTNADIFLGAIDDVLLDRNVFKIVLDMEEVEYISSAGLRVFTIISKRIGIDNICVTNMNEVVKEIIEATSFDTVITII